LFVKAEISGARRGGGLRSCVGEFAASRVGSRLAGGGRKPPAAESRRLRSSISSCVARARRAAPARQRRALPRRLWCLAAPSAFSPPTLNERPLQRLGCQIEANKQAKDRLALERAHVADGSTAVRRFHIDGARQPTKQCHSSHRLVFDDATTPLVSSRPVAFNANDTACKVHRKTHKSMLGCHRPAPQPAAVCVRAAARQPHAAGRRRARSTGEQSKTLPRDRFRSLRTMRAATATTRFGHYRPAVPRATAAAAAAASSAAMASSASYTPLHTRA